MEDLFARMSLRDDDPVVVIPFKRSMLGGTTVQHLFMTRPNGTFYTANKIDDITDDYLGLLGILVCGEDIWVDNKLVLIEVFEHEQQQQHWLQFLDVFDAWTASEPIPYEGPVNWTVYYERAARGLTFPGLPTGDRWPAIYAAIAKQNS